MKLVTVIIKAFNFDEVRGQWEERYERRYGFCRGFLDERLRRSVVQPGGPERVVPERTLPKAGFHRAGRPLETCEPTLDPEKGAPTSW